ncbi:MAG: DUF3455 domain-containing protein [Bryobacteraceae bacterium]|jgi:uncharacterized protein DUF3455
MMRFLLITFTLLASAAAQVPDKLKPPDTETVLLKAIGKGKQVYLCKDAKWVLDRPEASLFDERGKQIGRHYKGPTWETEDGGKVTGQVQERSNAPQADAVPWLLLKATSGAGGFSRVTYIQRVDTEGGMPPAGACSAGGELSVDYRASYYFYAPKN